MSRCLGLSVSLRLCVIVSLCLCLYVTLCLCVLVFRCLAASASGCFSVSVSWCLYDFVSLCLNVSASLCLCVSGMDSRLHPCMHPYMHPLFYSSTLLLSRSCALLLVSVLVFILSFLAQYSILVFCLGRIVFAWPFQHHLALARSYRFIKRASDSVLDFSKLVIFGVRHMTPDMGQGLCHVQSWLLLHLAPVNLKLCTPNSFSWSISFYRNACCEHLELHPLLLAGRRAPTACDGIILPVFE